MQPTELRIGNMIFDSECHPHYFKVEQIARRVGYELWVVYRNGSVKCKNPEPIHLTPEILLKVGFVEHDLLKNTYGNGVIGIYFNGTEAHYNIAKCKYLHQFQNLYFALTGTELNVDELLK